MSFRDHIAPPVFELLGRPAERKAPIREIRRKLLAAASGRVLEVGAGTGFNLPHYPAGIDDLTLTDQLEGMLRRARRRAAESGRTVVATLAPVERLPFEDDTFDTVVGSGLLCSVENQDRALAEIRRVLKPGGRYLFLEHVRSSDPNLARSQDRWERPWGVITMGCHPNRDTLPRIQSIFAVEELEQSEFPLGPKLVRPYVLGRAIAAPV